jgi:transposase
MLSSVLFLGVPGLRATPLQWENSRFSTRIHSTRSSVPCPSCRTLSRRIHSRYWRAPADLPAAGIPVTLRVEARRFYCDRPDCPRRTFREVFPGFLAPYRRQTERLNHRLRAIGLALGGQAGARLAGQLGFRVSPDTRLRRLRRPQWLPVASVRWGGVDDWAFRRGHPYGTILVDLERHRPIDLLPDRKAETLAAWLQCYPEIQLISRDRAGAYAEGARQGAPQAVQVADRRHLLKNLRETVERALNRYPTAVRQTAEAVVRTKVPETTAITIPASGESRPRLPTRAEQARQARRDRRFARYEAACDLRRPGGTLRAMARPLDLDRRTVRRFLQADGFPERAARPPVPSLLDPFRDSLQHRWTTGCHRARPLFHVLKAQGFSGSEGLVRKALHPWRSRSPEALQTGSPAPPEQERGFSRRWAPSLRQVSFWFLDLGSPQDPGDYERAHHLVRDLCAQTPDWAALRDLGQDFMAMVRERRSKALPAWLERVREGPSRELKAFAQGLESDYDAVLAALQLPWRQGQVEGQVNRLKRLKRSM